MSGKTKVALLFGGRSAEHEISLISAASIFKNLDSSTYETRSIYINRTGDWKPVESPFQPPEELNRGKFHSFLPWAKSGPTPSMEADIYFPVLHGPFGEDGTIQGLLEMAGVPYVGATVLASSTGMDKATAKKLFEARGLPVAEYVVLLEEDWQTNRKAVLAKLRESFSLPFFVKPSNLGSSVGITKVKAFEKAGNAVDRAFHFDEKVLVEEGILGREIECSVLGNASPQASLPGEVIPHREFYDYKDKYIEGRTSFGIPAELLPGIVKDIQRIAVEAFQAISCSGMARVDFFLQQRTNVIYVNEINTIPGFTEISMYPKLWEVSGLPFPELLDRLIRLGFEKCQRKKRNTEGFCS
jgi:D-alanine-D-alanine ligase